MALTKERHALARANRITSSRIAAIATGDYRAWNKLAETMRTAKPAPIGQKRTGVPSLDWGNRHEAQALATFWLEHPEYELWDEHWLYWHDPRNAVMYELAGTSPDATLHQLGQRVSGVEAKCPYDPAIHEAYIHEGVLPLIYQPQVAWHMIVSDLPYWWFCSFDPRKTDDRRFWALRCERDWAYEGELMDRVNRFVAGYLAGETFKPKAYHAADFGDWINERTRTTACNSD